jgi:simple sugar transport system permease protein
MTRRWIYAAAAPVIALVAALIVSTIALLASGHSPYDAFHAMATKLNSADSVVGTLNIAARYYVAGVAVALGFKMGLFNIGADGQLRIAALFAAAAGAAVHFPAVLHVSFIILVALLVGGAYAAIPGVLKVTRGVNEVVSTIMLNFIATGLSAYMLSVYLRDRKVNLVTQTKDLPKSAWLPSLNHVLRVVGYHLPTGTVLQGFLVIAVLVGIFFYTLIYRTRFGFELLTTGANPAAALSAGVNAKAMVVKTIVLSGAIAGLAAMGPLLSEIHNYGDLFPSALGFTGISVALLGRNHPGGIAAAAVVWAGIEQAGRGLSRVAIPQEISQIMQGALLISAVIAFEVVRRRGLASEVRDAAARVQAAPEGVGVA